MSSPPEPVTAPLQILLECPECGAPIEVPDAVVSLRCAHCGSLLVFQAPERDELYWTEGHVPDADAVLEVVIAYRLEAQRHLLAGQHQNAEGTSTVPELVIDAALKVFESRLRKTLRLVEARRVQAPYWHVSGMIVQAVLGRHHDGPKVLHLLGHRIDHAVPAYDTTRANLRDRGLRMGFGALRPLTLGVVQKEGPFLPWHPWVPESYREIDRWKGENFDQSLEPVLKDGRFLFTKRLVVYRPYWIARIISEPGEETILVDSTFGTLAGHPTSEEANAILAQATADPLGSTAPSFRHVVTIPSRCPDCDFEQAFENRAFIVVCPNCHRGLRVTASGIEIVHYGHTRPAAETASFLPFWRFPFGIEVGSQSAASLEEYAHILFPQGLPPGFHPRGSHLWAPAVRLLGSSAGDAVFQALVEGIHAAPPEVQDEKIPLDLGQGFPGVSVAEEDARELSTDLLFGLHLNASAARLNTLLVKGAIQEARIHLGAPGLVYVAVQAAGEGWTVSVETP
jgi:predicted RNA-binding Zn-ribbon protein involved in translation (DUF1610 family)